MWRDRIDQHYRELVPPIERGVIIGALRHAVLAGHGLRLPADRQRAVRALRAGPQLRLSLVIAPWALLLLFYFLRRLGKQGEMIGQIAGVVTAAVAVLRYEDLNDWAVRLLGIGSRRVDHRRRWSLLRVGRLRCARQAVPRHAGSRGSAPPRRADGGES